MDKLKALFASLQLWVAAHPKVALVAASAAITAALFLIF